MSSGGQIKYLSFKGFTLFEVLITLGIIGVVAALTIPTLIANYKEKEFVIRAKNAYSIIQNAVQLTRAEYKYGHPTAILKNG